MPKSIRQLLGEAYLSCFFLIFSISGYNGSKQVFLGVDFFYIVSCFSYMFCFILAILIVS